MNIPINKYQNITPPDYNKPEDEDEDDNNGNVDNNGNGDDNNNAHLTRLSGLLSADLFVAVGSQGKL